MTLARSLQRLGVRHKGQHLVGRYTLDEYLPDYRAAIEANGTYWHSRPEVAAKDQRKREALAALDIELLELGEAELRDGPELDERIRTWLAGVTQRDKAKAMGLPDRAQPAD